MSPSHDNGSTPPDDERPAALEQVVMKALERSPADRFASADEFARALLEPNAPDAGDPSSRRNPTRS